MHAEKPLFARVSHRFTASSERVCDAFLDVSKARRFLYATATGEMVRAELDARVGGTYVLTDRRGGADVEHTGTYLQIDLTGHKTEAVYRRYATTSEADLREGVERLNGATGRAESKKESA